MKKRRPAGRLQDSDAWCRIAGSDAFLPSIDAAPWIGAGVEAGILSLVACLVTVLPTGQCGHADTGSEQEQSKFFHHISD